MCGIAAIIGDDAERLTSTIERMTESLRHRGPDGGARRLLPGCALGHRRLSVIDLVTGDQPMADDSGRYWIVFNGEIYNYRELRQTLERAGARFQTRSDTEVILQAYRHYGEDAPRYLNGQFAFVIWDSEARVGFAARDRLGEKPLYWARCTAGQLLFASEIKALLASDLINPRLDRGAIDLYLALLYVPPDRTIYENVETLLPGHAMRWHAGHLRTWSYWSPTYSLRQDIDPVDATQQLRALTEQAVTRQMVADVPIGAFLSGGLDSSTVVALMSRHTDCVRTFAVGFGDLIDELPYARSVAHAYRTDHHELQMDIPVGEMLERMAEVYDEPFADSSNIPTYLMSEYARRHVTVVLAGDGGDEIFGGYEWYRWLNANGHAAGAAVVMMLKLAARGWRALAKLHGAWRRRADAVAWTAHISTAARRHPDLWERHLALSTGLKNDRVVFGSGVPARAAESALRAAYVPAPGVEGMDRATDFDLRCYLPGDILVKVDRAAMAHGLEVRAPFLDADLVEFVLSLPWRLRFRDPRLKGMLRAACGDLWPAELHERGKQGFGAPIWSWIHRPDVQSLLQRVSAPQSPLVAVLPGVRKALPKLNPQQVWTVLCLGLWLERHAAQLQRLAA